MNEHYIVAADHGHLRVYLEQHAVGQSTPGVQAVEAMDFPQGKGSYTDRDTDVAGRFNSSKNQGSGVGNPATRTGMSIDERLPMQLEEARRRVGDLATELNAFFAQRPKATWDFAAGPDLNGRLLEALTPEVRRRIRKSVTKDLVNQPAGELRAHFAESGDGDE